MINMLPISRAKGDPKIVEAGPSSLTPIYSTAKALGWFSIGLGMTELFGARRLGSALGLENRTGLIRFFGARELAAGVMTLSTEKAAGLWSRVAGDVFDLLLLAAATDAPRAYQRRNAKVAFLAVAAITAVDVFAARAITSERRRDERPRNYRDRSGFPKRTQKPAPALRDQQEAWKRASA